MGKFILRHTNAGYSFVLKAQNSKIIGVSEIYAGESVCKKGIASVRANCSSPVADLTSGDPACLSNPKYEIFIDAAGEFRFRLKAANGEIILASQGYSVKSSCITGIASVGENAPDAEIVKEEGLN